MKDTYNESKIHNHKLNSSYYGEIILIIKGKRTKAECASVLSIIIDNAYLFYSFKSTERDHQSQFWKAGGSTDL